MHVFVRSLGVHLRHWSRKLPEQSIPHIAVGASPPPPPPRQMPGPLSCHRIHSNACICAQPQPVPLRHWSSKALRAVHSPHCWGSICPPPSPHPHPRESLDHFPVIASTEMHIFVHSLSVHLRLWSSRLPKWSAGRDDHDSWRRPLDTPPPWQNHRSPASQ